MSKILTMLAVVSVLSLGWVADSQAMGSMDKEGSRIHETSTLIGASVMNPAGEELGFINDLVIDSEGRVVFAILFQSVDDPFDVGRYVAVPFSALSISGMKPGEMHVVLNIDPGKLASAPSFDGERAMTDSRWEVDVYRYFGQQAYWNEEMTEEAQPGATWWDGYSYYP